MYRSLALVAVLLLAGAAAAEALTGSAAKNDIFQKSFKITAWTDASAGEGWRNITVLVQCRNITPEGPYMFPYEEMDYVLAIKPIEGPMELVAQKKFVLEDDCQFTASGRYSQESWETNKTFVHLFKPAHSRIPAMNYYVLTIEREQESQSSIFAPVGEYLSGVLSNPWPYISILLGGFLCLLALLLFFKNPILGIIVLMLGGGLLALGVWLAMSAGAPPTLPTSLPGVEQVLNITQIQNTTGNFTLQGNLTNITG